MIAGFIVRLVESGHPCKAATDQIECCSEKEASIFIKLQDRGGLKYPDPLFAGFVKAVLDLLEKFANSELQMSDHVVKRWLEVIQCHINPVYLECGCKDKAHTVKLRSLVLRHLIKLYFTNFANKVTDLNDVPKFENKPRSKKVKKL